MRSRSAPELLLTQKTKLPRLSKVCSGIPRHLPDDICGLNGSNMSISPFGTFHFALTVVNCHAIPGLASPLTRQSRASLPLTLTV
ncbi:MAG: hypothetical protein A4E65_00741 [Syntrophorhabdus sp. PtaU1.Bin153]|nr:MAG: hypothetical protein A4E65_00741 [Syntrophorhabdus sp. PtaU1.Bin153]